MTNDLKDRGVLITGANSGIGRALALELAARGAAVTIATRSEERTRPLLVAAPSLSWLSLDLADLDSVRRAAERFLASGARLDVLVNNAGIAGTRALGPQGFDVTYATNHIGPFLLTSLLMPRLREAPQGRIVNVASAAHFMVKTMDWSALERRTKPKRSLLADYAVTKLMNILHVRELARRLAGSRVTTYAVHPGTVATNIWRALPGVLQWVGRQFMISSEEGAETPLFCATAPALVADTGKYYEKSREARPSRLAQDEGLARALWERTERAVDPRS